MQRRLNSDQLGEKGGARFRELCTDAGLVPNPSTWDRKGWDFVVDWPFAGNGSFDARPTPLSCLVQLKTVWVGAKSIRLRLSAIEHLAKDLKPAFIQVLEVDDTLNLAGARVAHLEGGLLAVVLKALRQATVEGDVPNKVFINLSLDKWFNRLLPTAQAIRAAFEQAIGPEMPTYASSKQRQLTELGFEDGRMSMKTTFEVDDEEHVIEAFLGLRKLKALSITTSEKRFGIELPVPGMELIKNAEMEFSPRPEDTCDITAIDETNDREFRFHGDVYRVPSMILQDGRLKVLIRCPLFDWTIDGWKITSDSPELKVNISLNSEKIQTAKLRASEWRDLHGFMATLGQRTLRISFKARRIPGPIIGVLGSANDPAMVKQWDMGERVAAIANDMLERAGWPATKLSLNTLWAAREELEALNSMVYDPSSLSPLSFTTKPGGQSVVVDGRAVEALYFSGIDLGKHFRLCGLVRSGCQYK